LLQAQQRGFAVAAVQVVVEVIDDICSQTENGVICDELVMTIACVVRRECTVHTVKTDGNKREKFLWKISLFVKFSLYCCMLKKRQLLVL
jgi:hypothetical protein